MNSLARTARERLTHRRNTILGLVRANETVRDATLPDVDRAAGNEDVPAKLFDREGHELREIEAALTRIEDGTYGKCERCDGAIGRQRLAAIPEARMCIRCSDA